MAILGIDDKKTQGQSQRNDWKEKGVENVRGLGHFDEIRKTYSENIILIFYSDTSEKSRKALATLNKLKIKNPQIPIFSVNVSQIKDIHPRYGVDAVPAVMVFKQGIPMEMVYGLQSEDYYERLISPGATTNPAKPGAESKSHRVVIYTSSSCPWCAAAKAYLSKNRIPFREINVSQNPSAAAELVKRTGQTGVPQLDIDGTFVVGFDRPKIDKLLGIN